MKVYNNLEHLNHFKYISVVLPSFQKKLMQIGQGVHDLSNSQPDKPLPEIHCLTFN